MQQEQIDQDKRDAKHRSRVMLAATLLARGLACNVRIRNVSETGALLEGDVLPDVGTQLILQRGEHEMNATVMWVRGGRCGVRFADLVTVSDWAGVQPAAQADALPLPSSLLPQLAVSDPSDAMLPRRIGEEIAYVQRLIDSIGNELVANPVFVNRYQRALQNFDLASQILGHLSRVMLADDQLGAAEKVGLTDLRNRLLRS